MKTFKQLREKWYKSMPNPYIQSPSRKYAIDIYKNPNRKEIKICTDKGYGGFRAFLISNGDMFAWSDKGAIHDTINTFLSGDLRTNYIPIVGDVKGNKITIKISTDIHNTIYRSDDIKDVAEIVRNHRQIKRLFSDITVIDKGMFA